MIASPDTIHVVAGCHQGSTSQTGAVAVSAVPVSRPDSKTRDRSGNAGNWSETPETARFPVPGLHREITSRREVKPWLYVQMRCSNRYNSSTDSILRCR